MRPGRFLLACAVVLSATEFVPAHADTIRVTIDNLVFAPANVSAKVGDTIEWVNNDVFAHTATVRGDWDVMIAPKKTALRAQEIRRRRVLLPLPPQHERAHCRRLEIAVHVISIRSISTRNIIRLLNLTGGLACRSR